MPEVAGSSFIGFTATPGVCDRGDFEPVRISDTAKMWAKVVISFLEIAYPLRRHQAAVLRVDSQRNGLLSGNLRRTFPARHGPVTGKVFAVGFDLELAAKLDVGG